jgi:LAGLIDADG endonuclease
VGSRSKTDLAYIAGFLDGDGSLMLQLKKRKDGKTKSRFMVTICFYQDSRHKEDLYWIQSVFNVGYISHRNDGMSELRINGYKTALLILKQLMPYIRFKRIQAAALLKAAKLLDAKPLTKLTLNDLKSLVGYMLEIQSANYVTKYKRPKEELYKVLGLTP